ncbi:MAG: NUDIX hydrolase [Acidimicrobiales bacterium]
MSQAWELLRSRAGSAGYLPVRTNTYLLPDGTEADWDIFGHDASVAVLAITDAAEVVLVRQYRPGPGLLLDELPGGLVDEGEDTMAAAARELLEETGYVGALEMVGSTWLAGASRTRRYIVVARHCRQLSAPAPEPGEFCDVVKLPLHSFRAHLRSGRLTDVDLGYLALDHLGMLGEPGPLAGT